VTADLSVDRNVDAFRFTVAASNKAGSSLPSAASAAQTARGKPSSPELVSVAFDPNGTTVDGQVTVTFKESTDAGDDKISYFYQRDSAAWTEVPGNIHTFGPSATQHSFVVGGLTYGTSYTFRFEARNDSYESDVDVVPPTGALYGMFDAPSVKCGGSGQDVTCSWNAGTARGNNVTLQLRGSPLSQDRTTSGSQTVTVGFDRSGTQQITAVDQHSRSKAGAGSNWQTAPSPSVSIGIGDRSADPNGCVYGDAMATGDTQGCYNVVISMNNFSSGNHVVRCYETRNAGTPGLYKTINHAGGGTFQDCSFSSAGRWVMVVVDGSIGGFAPTLDQCGAAAANHDGYFSGCTAQWPTN
jgi:hypothetical protein